MTELIVGHQQSDTHQKALRINLDPRWYGTIAEIGAGRGSFVNLDNYRPEYLPIFSRDVLRRIAAGDDSWEGMVPPEVAGLIKRRGFFGYAKAGRD